MTLDSQIRATRYKLLTKNQGLGTKNHEPMLTLKLLGIFLGVLARAIFPWLRKLRQGKVTRFHKRYLYSAIGSVIIGIIVTLLVFPRFEITSAGQGTEAELRLFATAFGFGFGWHAIVSEVGKWSGAFKNVEGK